MNKSFFHFLNAEFGIDGHTLKFRFPIETLEQLIKKFYLDYAETSFLIHGSAISGDIALSKMAKSYFLNVPLKNTNEHIYIGLSGSLSFLIVFDEPSTQFMNEESSRLFITFEPKIIASVFDDFNNSYCDDLSAREKRLLLKLKDIQSPVIDAKHVNDFQEVLLVNALGENDKIKKSKISEAISYTDEAVVITDLVGFISQTNKNCEKYFGKNCLKTSIKNYLPADFVEEAFSKVFTEKSYKSELNVKTVENKSQLLYVTCFLYRDEVGRPAGYVLGLKDVTDLKKLDFVNKQLIDKLRQKNLELSGVNKRLVEAEKIRTDLLSVISHELKTPISSIMGFGELIAQRDYPADTVKDFAKQILTSANSLNKLICNYLEVATTTFGADNNVLQTSPVNIKVLIEECFKSEIDKYKNKEIKFEVNSIGYDPIVFTEVENIKKLFSNLISNSIKFTEITGKIMVSILSDGEKVTISITDDGIGLSREQAKQVFEPFYRADNSITRQFSGIGLGLSVCKKIVDLYNGSIWCEPGLEKGTVFYVTLPVNPHKAISVSQNIMKDNSLEKNRLNG